jgi:hypothetical protein
MRAIGAALAITLVVGCAVSLVGCAPMSRVSVPDVTSVAGKWTGMVYLPGNQQTHVELTIREDGSYDAVSHERIYAPRGKGKIAIRDGRLVLHGEKGEGIGTLFRHPDGGRTLEIEMTLSDNSHLKARLTRSP